MIKALPFLPPAIVLRWRPVRRANPRSTLVGYCDVQLPSGMILRGLSVCASDGTQWIVPPSRLRVDINNVPLGIGDDARWDSVIEFRDRRTRDRFCQTVLNALRTDYPDAFGAARSPPVAVAVARPIPV
jgi:hypothetical protein